MTKHFVDSVMSLHYIYAPNVFVCRFTL